MALSYFTESEAPRDFRVSSTESDSHYTKCVLCYTVKRNFYCPECVQAGNFVHSSMPYADRYAEKQAKLLRLKANRRHVLERCERLLLPCTKRDALLTDTKHTLDQIQLLKLAIQQRRENIDNKRKELTQLKQANDELRLKLPRYAKRVSSLSRHCAATRSELATRTHTCTQQGDALAALRRARLRHLTRYIFPVYVTHDASDSVEELEFVVCSSSPPSTRAQLHVLAAWLPVETTGAHIHDDMAAAVKEAPTSSGPAPLPACTRVQRECAALALAAQLTALIVDVTHTHTPYSLALSDYYSVSNSRQFSSLHRRLSACCSALAARARLPQRGLIALTAICDAASAEHAQLGRVEGWLSDSTLSLWDASVADVDADAAAEDEGQDLEPPEHLHWPEHELEHSASPPSAAVDPPPPSLVTSAAASLVSMWRGWTK